jgi:F-type H+-transporting ATPase subunit b
VRTRHWIAGAGIAVLALFAVAAPASAEPAGEEEEHCIELLEDGGEVDDCHEAPSPLAPEPNEIIWGTLAFLVLLVGMWKFGVPAVRNMMEAREERIRNDLERAEAARTEADATLQQYQAQLADARAEAGRIIEEARQSAEQVRRDLISRAEAEAQDLRARANADIQIDKERAMAELRSRVGELAIQLAEKIVERNLDRQTQMALVNSFIDGVGRQDS